MKNYALYLLSNGLITQTMYQTIEPDPSVEFGFIELDTPVSVPSYVLNGVVMTLPPQPGDLYEWTATGWELIAGALDQAKANKNAEINQSRAIANRSYFMFAGKKIAADEVARSDIDAINGFISLSGGMPPNWIGAWKTLSNEWVSIPDKSTWIQFYGAMVGQGSANFAQAQTLKASVTNAQTIAEVEAIQWV